MESCKLAEFYKEYEDSITQAYIHEMFGYKMQDIIIRRNSIVPDRLDASYLDSVNHLTALPEEIQRKAFTQLQDRFYNIKEATCYYHETDAMYHAPEYDHAHGTTYNENEKSVYNIIVFNLITKNSIIPQWFIEWMTSYGCITINDSVFRMLIHLLAYGNYAIIFEYPFNLSCSHDNIYKDAILECAKLYGRNDVVTYFK